MDILNTVLEFLARPAVQFLLLLWIFVVLLATAIYYLIDFYRRKNYLRRFGLSSREYKPKINYVELVTELFNKVFSGSSTTAADKFLAAGVYNTKFASWVQPIKYILAGSGAIGIGYYGYLLAWELMDFVIYVGIWVVVSVLLPDFYLSMRTKKLQQHISNRLPYLLDLMGVCVQTGMTIESSMGYLANEMENFDKDLAYLLKRTNDRARLVGLDVALQELYDRVPTTEVRSFVMTLNQSLQYGSSIYHVLTTLAVDIREVQMLGLEEKIGKLAAKMSIPLILFIMLPIVILITAPGIMRMLGSA